MNAIKKTKSKRLISMLLALCLVVGLLPGLTVLVQAADAPAIQTGASFAAGETVYLGQYTSGGTTYNVPWVVLADDALKGTSANPGTIPLLSKYLLGESPFRAANLDLGYYSGSTLQQTMNERYNTLFSAEEKGLIASLTLKKDSMHYSTSDIENARLFPMSWQEAYNIDNEWGTELLKAKRIGDPEGGTNGWWLRSSNDDFLAIYTNENGLNRREGIEFSFGVRPAFKLNLNSVLFTSAAVGGKGTFDKVANKEVTEWKLTLKDGDTNFAAMLPTSGEVGEKLTVDVTALGTGAYDQISAMLVNGGGEVVAYGKIGANAAGKTQFTIPTTISPDTYTLKVFPEKLNGDQKTDYAGNVVETNITIVAAGEHSSSKAIPQVDATCTQPGVKEHFQCDSCGKYFGDRACQNEITDLDAWKTDEGKIDPLPHSFSAWTETEAPNCTKTGSKERECMVCGQKETETVAELGHDYRTDWSNDADNHWHECTRCRDKKDVETHEFSDWTETEAPNCTKTGSKERECTVCGQKETETVAELGHDYRTDWSNDADNHWHECTRCGDKKDVETHEFSDWTETEAPNCTKTGSKERECTVCGQKETETFEALGHDYRTDWSNDADNHWHECTRCGDKKDVENHEFSDWTETEAPNCTKTGSKERECTVCGQKETETFAALGHDYRTDWSNDADNHWHECTRCGDKKDAATHTWNYTSATEEHDKHCTVCGYVAEAQLTHTHSGSLVEAKEPTFTTDGNIEYYTCSCGKLFKDASCSVEITDVVLHHLLYAITEGKDGVYTKGSGKTLTFIANGPEEDCTGVKIDGALIDAANYTKVSGSTIITLNNAYLEKLSDGDHSIIVAYGTREEATAKFTIKAAQVLPSKTGDNSNMLLWIALLLTSCGGVITTCVVKRKRLRSK